MWNSTSSPQTMPKPGCASRASACCRTRRVSSGTGVPSWNHGWQRSQPVPCAQGSCLKLAGSGSSIRLLANAKPGSSAVPPGSNTLNAVRSEVSLSSSVLTMPTPVAQGLDGGLGRQRLAAQHAVQVAPAEAHQLQAAGLDQAGGVQRRSLAGFIVDAAELGE